MTYFSVFLPINVTDDEEVVVMCLDYLHKLGDLLAKTDKKTLANYVIWRVLYGLTDEMTEKFRRERNAYSRVLQVG
jgi:predicted metalloendopeptidase